MPYDQKWGGAYITLPWRKRGHYETEESLESLEPLDSLESLENARTLL